MQKGAPMGLLDRIKGLLSGRKEEIKSGIDKSSNFVGSKVGEKNAAKVENVAEKAKDTVDKLD